MERVCEEDMEEFDGRREAEAEVAADELSDAVGWCEIMCGGGSDGEPPDGE
jgi:hypothetical protein